MNSASVPSVLNLQHTRRKRQRPLSEASIRFLHPTPLTEVRVFKKRRFSRNIRGETTGASWHPLSLPFLDNSVIMQQIFTTNFTVISNSLSKFYCEISQK